MSMQRALVGGFVLAVIGLSGPLAVAAEKESRKCRKEIGAKLGKVVKTELGIVDACHKLRDKGKFTGDCNDLAAADVKGKRAKAEAAAAKGIDKKCLPGDLVLGNYALGDPDGAYLPVAADAVEASGAALLGAPALVGDKPKVKCHAEISKAALKNINEILTTAIKCQSALDKTALVFGAVAGNCIATPAKSGPKGEAAIAKKCSGVTGTDVGSCEPLPTCVTTSSTATGQALATALYGEPTAGCGNTITDPGEECDDGNQLTTDGCVACQLAACGDGFVQAGVELCGDAPPDACADPGTGTCVVTPCTPDGQTVTATVRFTKPLAKEVAGLVIALDYPETAVQIPGTAEAPVVRERVIDIPDGLQTVIDRDYEVQVGLTAFPIAPGVFYRVNFDSCGAPTSDQFACVVRSASDDQLNDITTEVNCSVTVP